MKEADAYLSFGTEIDNKNSAIPTDRNSDCIINLPVCDTRIPGKSIRTNRDMDVLRFFFYPKKHPSLIVLHFLL
jgi:hypothetical protein